MKIATWNINGLRARLDFIKIWLADRAPDVVGLQELKTTDEEFPTAEFEALGYQCLTHGQKGWNGVAILSRVPFELRHAGLPGEEHNGARLITARIDDDFDFTTVYCPNGKSTDHDDYAMKLAWYDSLASHWESQYGDGDRAAVLCGDFNIVPQPIDGWRGEAGAGDVFHTDAERERFQRLHDLGLIDTFRHRYPAEQQFSWWDYRGGAFHRKQGLRIDLILATAPLHTRIADVMIDREYRKKKEKLTASDHAPVIAELH